METAIQISVFTAFSDVPKKALILRCCLIHLKNSCRVKDRRGSHAIKGKGDFWGYVSLVKMAEAVGIGAVGKNGLLFSSRYGPRLLLGGVVTTASLPTMAWPEKDEQGCPKECFVCQEVCPVNAIDKSGKVDRVACLKHSMKSPIFSSMMKTGEIPPQDVEMINHTTAVDDHSMYRCIQCVSVCPYL